MLIRRPLLYIAPLAIVGLALVFLTRFQQLGPYGLYFQDFVEYWSAGHLNANGQNPYDPELMFALETKLRPDLGEPVMMWNPPWTLALVMPVSFLQCDAAHLVWLILSLSILLVGSDFLWRFYGGILRYRGISWFIALSFTPTMLVLEMGQITPLILLGLIGFLFFERNNRDLLAGVCLALTAIKPHLIYLVGLAILLWSVERRRWLILLGTGVTLLLAMALALIFNPSVLNQYWYSLSHRPPERFYSPTIGTYLRLLFGPEKFRLQFVPVIFGLGWFAWYWLRWQRNWKWSEQLPVLLLASYLTATYGTWPFDYVVMLIPVIIMAVRVVENPRPGIVIYAAVSYLCFNLLASWLRTFSYEYHHWSIWMTPMLILMYMTLAKTGTHTSAQAR
jgi:hypothetical protein